MPVYTIDQQFDKYLALNGIPKDKVSEAYLVHSKSVFVFGMAQAFAVMTDAMVEMKGETADEAIYELGVEISEFVGNQLAEDEMLK